MDDTAQIESLLTLKKDILAQPAMPFASMTPKKINGWELRGVYLIAHKDTHEVLYVGKTVNMTQRLYTNHLMGNKSTARLKKYLVEDELRPEVETYDQAKAWLKSNCYCRWLKIDDRRKRERAERGLSYILNSRYLDDRGFDRE